jgi:hypothetical protein
MKEGGLVNKLASGVQNSPLQNCPELTPSQSLGDEQNAPQRVRPPLPMTVGRMVLNQPELARKRYRQCPLSLA